MLRKADEESKRKAEEAEVAKALEDFENTFQQSNRLDRAWVKGGVVNPGSEASTEHKSDVPSSSSIYKPVSKFGDKSLKTLEVGKVESKGDGSKKPMIGRKSGQAKKMTNLELFKEELKRYFYSQICIVILSLQKQREQRHQLRQQNRARGISESKIPQSLPTSELSLEYDDLDKRNRLREYGYPYDEDTDKSTTNLFLGNLCPKMTEQQLCDIFGRYGPLASVKIMWPRTEEQRAVARNCGFVAFMNRIDAERALENLRGKELMGYEMKLGWGKTVPIPVYPVYVPPLLLELIKAPSQSGLPFNAQPRDWLKSLRPAIKERAKLVTESIGNGDSATHSLPPAPDRFPYNIHTMPKETFAKVLEEAVVKVVIPSDRTVLATIHRLIEFVVREGPQFEAAIMHREEKNPQYKFLFDYQTPEHLYYRWKLWSILHGEPVNKWSLEEFRMYDGGPLWRPPPINFFTNGMPEELVEPADYPVAPGYHAGRGDDAVDFEGRDDAFRRGVSGDRGGTLGLTEAQRSRLAVWINDLEPSRAQVGDVMLWCLEHADAAPDVVDIIAKSLKRPIGKLVPDEDIEDDGSGCDVFTVKPATSVSSVVARLFLTSDILYNSGAKVPNASFYRKCFESRLFEIFNEIGSFFRELESKLKAEQLKQKVMLCFRAWEEWAIYPNDFLIQLQNVFLGLTLNVASKKSTNISEMDEEAVAGAPLEPNVGISKSSGMTAVTANVESLDGAPLVQYDGDPLDVDGSPLNVGGGNNEEDEDIEGVPLDTAWVQLHCESLLVLQISLILLWLSSSSIKSRDVNKLSSAAAPLFVPSKWESIDPDKAAEEAVTSNRWDLFADSSTSPSKQPSSAGEIAASKVDIDEDVDGKPLDGFGAAGLGLVAYDDDDALSPSPPPQPTNEPISDSRRQALREIEMKVVKYQDELEACRKRGDSSVTDEAISKQVDRFRERLLERLEETQEASAKSSSSKSIGNSKNSSSSKSSKPPFSSASSKRRHGSNSSTSKRHDDNRSSRRRHSRSPDDGTYSASPMSGKRLREELADVREEGEASDDEGGNTHNQHKRSRRRDDENRNRDRSPRRSRRSRSRSPSPSRRRGGITAPSSKSSQKKK
ncbi:U2-associated protein SR140 [Echinococcus granulosus]|uniref:U2-associated protein SR140 n=1 Tax=Echinococcus granulosus TaxID=6210 RepID=W6UDY1_ECHGR|nr:U2-associated protein SR140 [Echinococcus granulosus]EUB59243.1 U2-associated protein SR140 [Echinococcus granulosus]